MTLAPAFMRVEPLAVYVHWPYCVSKCPYCDFNSHQANAQTDYTRWLKAYEKELEDYAIKLQGRVVTSIFFGGGTPSLMPPEMVARLLQAVRTRWRLSEQCEITLEANPSSAISAHFAALKDAGVNRLSIGVQSFDNQVLQFFGRAHDVKQADAAIAAAATYFDRFSFDLMYAYIGQTPEHWRSTLQRALAFGSKHLSVYQLTIEPNTAFATRAEREELILGPDAAADLYDMTQDILGDAGLPAYEVSNHAAPNEASRHNLAYWQYDDYIGVGPGAHGRCTWSGTRHATTAHRHPDVWLKEVEQHGHGRNLNEPVHEASAMREALLMGLRLNNGIERARWREKFSKDVPECVSAHRLKKLEHEGLMELTEAHLRVTKDGMVKLNGVLDYLLNAA